MIITIDGQDYSVSSEQQQNVLRIFYAKALEKYEALEAPLRLALKPISREILRRLEKKGGKAIRPAPGADPTLHLFSIFLALVTEGLDHATATIATDGARHAVTALGLSVEDQGSGG